MRKELSDKLRQKYPKLYLDQNRAPPRWCAFACGSGWYTLLDAVSELLTKHSDQVSADQVKEKFGTLRFYHSPVDRYTSGVEVAAGQLSSIICDECGALARTKSDKGWLFTRCVQHSKKHSRDISKTPDLSLVTHLELGKAWSEMMKILLELCEWFTNKNNMPAVALDIRKYDDKLLINAFGGDEFTRGMIDLFITYANRIDENTGQPKRAGC